MINNGPCLSFARTRRGSLPIGILLLLGSGTVCFALFLSLGNHERASPAFSYSRSALFFTHSLSFPLPFSLSCSPCFFTPTYSIQGQSKKAWAERQILLLSPCFGRAYRLFRPSRKKTGQARMAKRHIPSSLSTYLPIRLAHCHHYHHYRHLRLPPSVAAAL